MVKQPNGSEEGQQRKYMAQYLTEKARFEPMTLAITDTFGKTTAGFYLEQRMSFGVQRTK